MLTKAGGKCSEIAIYSALGSILRLSGDRLGSEPEPGAPQAGTAARPSPSAPPNGRDRELRAGPGRPPQQNGGGHGRSEGARQTSGYSCTKCRRITYSVNILEHYAPKSCEQRLLCALATWNRLLIVCTGCSCVNQAYHCHWGLVFHSCYPSCSPILSCLK